MSETPPDPPPLPLGPAVLPRLLGYEAPTLNLSGTGSAILAMLFLFGLTTLLLGAVLAFVLHLSDPVWSPLIDDAPFDQHTSLPFGITAALIPFACLLFLMSQRTRPPTALSTAHPEPARRAQADLLAHLLHHLSALDGLEARVEAPQSEATPLGWCVHLSRSAAPAGWVRLDERGERQRLEVCLQTRLPTPSLLARLAAHPQAREALDALGLRAASLGLAASQLPDGSPALLSPDLGLNLPLDACLRAIPSPPADLREDPALAAALLLAYLAAAAQPPAPDDAAPPEPTPALRLTHTRPRHGDALASRDARWNLADPPPLQPAPLPPPPLALGRLKATGGGLAVALGMGAAALVCWLYNTGSAAPYLTLGLPALLIAATLEALLLDDDRPTWGRPPTSHLRAAPARPLTLDLTPEGTLHLAALQIDLQRPFTLELTRAQAAPDAQATSLHLSLLQRDPDAGVQRLTLRVPGLLLDATAADLPILDAPHAPDLASGDLLRDLWPLLRAAAEAHGQTLRLEPAPLDP